MAKAPTSDAIMPADKLKPLLMLSKREPVQAAIGLTAEGEGLLLLDKKATPRKVMSMLRAHADKAKVKLNGSSLRFGRAEVDPEYDPGVVRLFINKDAPGLMRVKLTEVVKRIPFQKVEINVDPSLEEEGAEGSEAGAAEAAAAPPPAVPPPPPQAPARPALDAAGLTRVLRELVGRMQLVVAETPALKGALTKLAVEAGNDIKAGALEAAAGALAKMRGALESASGAPAAAARNGSASSDWAGARQAWQDANDAVNGQINALRAELLNRAKTDDEIDEYAEALTEIAEKGLNAITEDHRVKLMAAVMELGGTATPATGAKALGQIKTFEAFLAGSEKIAVCDENPFGAPVSIRATLSPALQRMAAVLQPGAGG